MRVLPPKAYWWHSMSCVCRRCLERDLVASVTRQLPTTWAVTQEQYEESDSLLPRRAAREVMPSLLRLPGSTRTEGLRRVRRHCWAGSEPNAISSARLLTLTLLKIDLT